jgi:2-polyprenyl-3-methyl-5-hydroxy-6-metoxy-1,4-benzoquinol methylase
LESFLKTPTCRFCNEKLISFCDLGLSPLANSFLEESQLHTDEAFYPLHTYICETCHLVQLEEFECPKNIFTNYAYFSSFSETWLKHCRAYTNNVISRFKIDHKKKVIEIASNDGYLLKYFKDKNIPVLGIEPAENVARKAEASGVTTVTSFFNSELAKELKAEKKQADLVICNNVLAHVPNLNDFIAGLKILLKPEGVITLEFPSLMKLIEQVQFDTIYHEHFSYFSFLTAENIFAHHGLTLFDVEELNTHGGSLRIYVQHQENTENFISENVSRIKLMEKNKGMDKLSYYLNFTKQVEETKRQLYNFLTEKKQQGKAIAAYGAPAKGNTLLSYCEVGNDLIDYTVDLNPGKQGHFLPGTHIPIFHPDKIKETKPDYLLILPWNIKNEIMEQMKIINTWGGKFVIPVPKVMVQQ